MPAAGEGRLLIANAEYASGTRLRTARGRSYGAFPASRASRLAGLWSARCPRPASPVLPRGSRSEQGNASDAATARGVRAEPFPPARRAPHAESTCSAKAQPLAVRVNSTIWDALNCLPLAGRLARLRAGGVNRMSENKRGVPRRLRRSESFLGIHFDCDTLSCGGLFGH